MFGVSENKDFRTATQSMSRLELLRNLKMSKNLTFGGFLANGMTYRLIGRVFVLSRFIDFYFVSRSLFDKC